MSLLVKRGKIFCVRVVKFFDILVNYFVNFILVFKLLQALAVNQSSVPTLITQPFGGACVENMFEHTPSRFHR